MLTGGKGRALTAPKDTALEVLRELDVRLELFSSPQDVGHDEPKVQDVVVMGPSVLYCELFARSSEYKEWVG